MHGPPVHPKKGVPVFQSLVAFPMYRTGPPSSFDVNFSNHQLGSAMSTLKKMQHRHLFLIKASVAHYHRHLEAFLENVQSPRKCAFYNAAMANFGTVPANPIQNKIVCRRPETRSIRDTFQASFVVHLGTIFHLNSIKNAYQSKQKRAGDKMKPKNMRAICWARHFRPTSG